MSAKTGTATFLRNVSIKWKLTLLAVFGLAALVLLSGLLLSFQYETSYEGRKVSIKQSVEIS